MNSSPFQELAPVLAILRKLKIPHALIGGWAVITWGYLRASDDLDMMIDIPVSGRKQLMDALSAAYSPEWREAGEDDPVSGIIRALPRPPAVFPVDFLLTRGRHDRAALGRARTVTVEDIDIPVVGPEDIVAMKLEAGGGQDYEDARRLLRILGDRLDDAALQGYCRDRRVLDRLALLRG